mmetsp:Transcript_20807/g.29089  ORF Transcript_20807/g.29089 Transcript_20807/m.29089 type:complete len:1229 (-) Transcript_20807:188-3874(-)
MVSLADNSIVTVAGVPGMRGEDDGDATSARFRGPEGMDWLDEERTQILICDRENDVIRLYDTISNEVFTLAEVTGRGGRGDDGNSPTFIRPTNIIVDQSSGFAFVAQTGAIRRLDTTSFEVTNLAGNGDSSFADGEAQDARLGIVEGIYLHRGILYFSDNNNNQFSSLRALDLTEEIVFTIGGLGTPSAPRDIVVTGGTGMAGDPAIIYYGDIERNTITKLQFQIEQGVNNTSIEDVVGAPFVDGMSGGIGMEARLTSPQAMILDEETATIYLGVSGGLFQITGHIPSQSPSSSPNTAFPTTIAPTQNPTSISPTENPTLAPTSTPTQNLAGLTRLFSNLELIESYPPWSSLIDVTGGGRRSFTLTNNLAGRPIVRLLCTSGDMGTFLLSLQADISDGDIVEIPNMSGSDEIILEYGEHAAYEVRAVYTFDHRPRASSVRCQVNSVPSFSGLPSSSFITEEIDIAVTIKEVTWPIVTDWLVEIDGVMRSSLIGGEPSSASYSVSLNTGTRIVALSDPDQGGIFGTESYNCPNVSVGGVDAFVESCLPGSVTFITPNFTELCTLGVECGYQQIVIKNSDGLLRPGMTTETYGGTLRCPGECTLDGLGFFYAEQCQGDFTSPLECAQIQNDPTNCAFGLGDRCRLCPENAYCPGGLRAWPKAGYWTADESIGTVARCPPPSIERCRGWDIPASESECGNGYTGSLCSSCTNGFFEQLSECVRCPEKSEGAIQLGVLIGGALVLFIVVYTCLRKSKIGDGRKEFRELATWQAKDFVIWTVLVLQLFTLVTSTASANAPAAKVVLAWVNIASFDFQAVGPECYSSNSEAFTREYVIFSIVLSALFLVPLLSSDVTEFFRLDRILSKFAKNMRGYIFTALTALYTPATFLGAGAVHCIESNEENRQQVFVSWANPNFECAGKDHRPVMILGLLVLTLHSVCFPIWSYVKIRGVYNSDERDKKLQARHYKKFFGDDYLPGYYWVLHAQMALAFTLCMTRVFLSAFNTAKQGAKLALNVTVLTGFMTLLLVLRPHVRHMRWKLPVQMSLLVLIIFASFLDLLNYLSVEDGTVSPAFVEGFSYFVLAFAMLNFMLLGYSFWFVVVHEKKHDFYAYHFLLQREGWKAPSLSFRANKKDVMVAMMNDNKSRSISAGEYDGEDKSGGPSHELMHFQTQGGGGSIRTPGSTTPNSYSSRRNPHHGRIGSVLTVESIDESKLTSMRNTGISNPIASSPPQA